jgi:REP-associated tyrosine transposase
MSNSLSRVLVHFVWSTWQRHGWVDESVEEIIRDAIAAQCERLECPLRAFGAYVDHVHVVTELHREVTLSQLVRAMKGASSHRVARHDPTLGFRWQQGYGVFSVSEREPDRVLAYVRAQRERHASGTIESTWEFTPLEIERNG